MHKLRYKIDYAAQKLFSSLIFQIPPLNIIKRILFAIRLKSKKVSIGYNIVITNFDNDNAHTGIKFNGICRLVRNIQIDTCGGITIGNNVLMSENVNIQTHKHEFDGVSLMSDKSSASPLIIEDEVWICQNVIITETVRKIAKGSIIATGSVLTKDTQEWEVWGGVPAKCIKTRKQITV